MSTTMQKFGAGPKKVGKHRRAQLAKLRARSVDDGEANKNAGFALFLMAAYYATGIIMYSYNIERFRIIDSL
jgi:hypothetical protein